MLGYIPVWPLKEHQCEYINHENCLLQNEKEVLALLSRLDLQNVHFVESAPGEFT